jgi:pseudouridine kinase
VKFIPGGVARNIAHSLLLLAASSEQPVPALVAAVGDDPAGMELSEHWRSLGGSTANLLCIKGAHTPVVSIIFDSRGDVAASVADVRLSERAINAESLGQYRCLFTDAFIIVLDGDLSQSAIECACRIAVSTGTRIWFEPASASKAVRVTNVIHLLDFVSPNIAEVKSLADSLRKRGIKSRRRWCKSAHRAQPIPANSAMPVCLKDSIQHLLILLDAGVRYILLTMGANGSALCSLSDEGQHASIVYVPALNTEVANTSGAGDACVAGFLHALSLGKTCGEALKFGVSAATFAVETIGNVPADITSSQVEKRASMCLSIPFSIKFTSG